MSTSSTAAALAAHVAGTPAYELLSRIAEPSDLIGSGAVAHLAPDRFAKLVTSSYVDAAVTCVRVCTNSAALEAAWTADRRKTVRIVIAENGDLNLDFRESALDEALDAEETPLVRALVTNMTAAERARRVVNDRRVRGVLNDRQVEWSCQRGADRDIAEAALLTGSVSAVRGALKGWRPELDPGTLQLIVQLARCSDHCRAVNDTVEWITEELEERRGDRELWREAVRCGWPPLVCNIIETVATGAIDGVGLSDVSGTLDEADGWELVQSIAEEIRPFGRDAAELVVEYYAGNERGMHYRWTPAVEDITAEAAEVLVASGHPPLIAAGFEALTVDARRRLVPDVPYETLRDLLELTGDDLEQIVVADKLNDAQLDELLEMVGEGEVGPATCAWVVEHGQDSVVTVDWSRLSEEQVATLLDRAEHDPDIADKELRNEVYATYLTKIAELPTAERLGTVMTCPRVVAEWLSGETNNDPQPGDVTELRRLAAAGDGRAVVAVDQVDRWARTARHYHLPWELEVLRSTPAEQVRRNGSFHQLAAELFAEEFGDSDVLWQFGVGLLEEWSGTLDELAATARMLADEQVSADGPTTRKPEAA